MRHLFEPGAEVSDPLAMTGPAVAGQTFMVWGPCDDFRCDSRIGDWTPRRPHLRHRTLTT